ncbi:PAS domain-containing methyl-accepting chemotaxis protein [Atlantibacter sp.]|uniref:methyl-accepting chemotaxis protein n=1 Tax=Atlantibacter sp. TaxID=1903473 RepID=UPI0028A03BBB|nr:PAS domain-containing methyl-accepting chemotaxis protein [Atlantibacter sp.]
MRINNPVTQHEYLLSDDATLMSTTDTQSYITYANSAFIESSGFSEADLVGQPHNHIRHPDMPPEAFADMWFTLKQGESWTGLVKNRRKNGDYYWVRANVTPVYRNETLTGYISVRNVPTREEIQTAEQLYQAVNEKRAGSLRFFKGLVVRGKWLRPLSLLQKISVAWRLGLPLAVFTLITLLLPLAGFNYGVQAVFTVAVAGVAGWFMQTQITRPLRTIVSQMQKIVSGRKAGNVHFNRVDEIGKIMRLVNQAGLNLHSLVNDVSVQASGISEISQQLEVNSTTLNERADETSAQLQQTAAAIEEITSAVQQTAATSETTIAMAERTSIVAQEGAAVMEETIDVMKSISKISDQIVDIIGVIDSIAFQTNILALNAAVEAARAGASGKGFAVVASEVRNLAQHSASSAKEIKTLIDRNVQSVRSGVEMVELAEKHISEMAGEIRQMSQLIKEVGHATGEQTSALSLINESVSQIETMSKNNADMVAYSTQIAGDLNRRGNRLTSAINVFGG